MKRIMRALLLAVPFLGLAHSAHAIGWDGGWPYKVEAGADVYLRVHKNPYDTNGGQLGPWYLYWPMEAHFWPQAPAAYGAWPQPMALPQQFNPPLPQAVPQYRPPMPTQLPNFQAPQPQPSTLPNPGGR